MKEKSTHSFQVRIILISCLIFLCFLLIVGRMFQLQVLKKEQLYKLADQQHRVRIPFVPKRGTVYDRNGNELAVSIEVDSVYVDPRKVVSVEKTARDLASVLQVDQEELQKRLKRGKSFEWIRRKISPKEVREINTLRLPGVCFLKENKRFYPNSQMASHLIGFAGLDSKGLEGIEYQYDDLLNGKGHIWNMERDALGREIAIGDGHFLKKEDHYKSIVLTLDKHIQHVVETELNQSVQKWGAKGGLAIAMDPTTGKVLAMASNPTFDPNRYIQYRPKSWKNRSISDAFEPGSLFKVFLAAAALGEKVVQPLDSFYCEGGSYKVYDRTIHDHSKHGWLTFQQIIKVSSNIGASKVGEKMGRERLYRYICAFGFGEKTGIGLPGEGRGIVHHPRYWPPVALDTISFGQGISVTGIQLVTALSAITNGGILMRPSVVERVINEKGEIIQSFQPEAVRKVISEETSRKIMAILKTATEKGGTGEAAVPRGYEVGGKTGTAQKADPFLGGYSQDRYVSGFMGYVPSEGPKIVLLILIDEPRGSYYGGVVAAPVFKAIMEKVLPYLNIYPKGTLVVKNKGESLRGDREQELGPSIERVRVGNGVGKEVMPDLTGLSMRNALICIERKGLIIKFSGNGKVVEQTPKAGTMIEKGDICYLKLKSPS